MKRSVYEAVGPTGRAGRPVVRCGSARMSANRPGSGCSLGRNSKRCLPHQRPVVEPVPMAVPCFQDRQQQPGAGPSPLGLGSAMPMRPRFSHRGSLRLRTTERPNGAETAGRQPNRPSSSDDQSQHDNMLFMLRLPFLYANTLAKTESHWLKQRNRSRWWKRGHFPKIPKDTVNDAARAEKVKPMKLLGKMLPLGVVFFCATFNLCILQNVKDTIMITQVGAESLPFLAAFGVLPASVGFFSFYGQLVNKLPMKSVFYAAVVPLLAFYVFFTYCLYPAAPYLHFHGFYEAASQYTPMGFHGLLKCIENWTYSAFFCVAELWGSVVISVLFWSLANDVCSVDEAKTIYPLMGISANIALVVAGGFIKKICKGCPVSSLQTLTVSVVVMTLFMMAGKLYLDKKVPLQPDDGIKKKKQTGKKKSKGTFKEGFAVLRESPKIMNLALLVIGYSVSHRLFDVAWKGQLKLVYPTALEYQSVLADVSVWTGMATICTMVTGKFIFQYLGWGFAAATTPVVMMVTGSLFFGLSIMYNSGGASMALAGIGALAGNITQVACKAAKYSLFDPAKEMVYIEMSSEEKKKGKAAVDLVGSQVGKTGASWMSQALLLAFGSISRSMPCISVLYGGVLIMWLGSVKKLMSQLKETEKERLMNNDLEGTITDSLDEESTMAAAAVSADSNGSKGAQTNLSGSESSKETVDENVDAPQSTTNGTKPIRGENDLPSDVVLPVNVKGQTG
ncbi:hypothetical protein BSKO_11075 [Bryopsis sp. KO-2023]|nr:hypothetical protein BSKO_11075 [Bryopsis sp. KO-2023]